VEVEEMFAGMMKARRWKTLLLIAGAAVIWCMQEVEYLRIDSPDGKFTAIVTHRRYGSVGSFFPGQAGDKAGFIRIEDLSGKTYGKIEVPMIWMSRDLQWTKDGAYLKLVGEWNFAKREYRFWNKSQDVEIVKRA
jgi:hypothetical protein